MSEWTETQWRLFRQAYEQEIDDARLAHKVIPMFEVPFPLVPSQRNRCSAYRLDLKKIIKWIQGANHTSAPG